MGNSVAKNSPGSTSWYANWCQALGFAVDALSFDCWASNDRIDYIFVSYPFLVNHHHFNCGREDAVWKKLRRSNFEVESVVIRAAAVNTSGELSTWTK